MDEVEKTDWASSIASMIGPSEAEASPISKPFKTTARAGIRRLEKSGTFEALKGTEFKGATIRSVVKGRGDWRYIVLDDGTSYPVTKDVLSDMMRAQGTAMKMGELQLKDQPGQLLQAFKSLGYHKARLNPFANQAANLEHLKAYKTQLEKAGVEVPPTSLVKHEGKTFTMPTPYAEILQKEGVLKILKRVE